MSRYVAVFLLILLIDVVLFFVIPVFNEELFDIDEILFSAAILLILLASFIITQLFYIIGILKKK